MTGDEIKGASDRALMEWMASDLQYIKGKLDPLCITVAKHDERIHALEIRGESLCTWRRALVVLLIGAVLGAVAPDLWMAVKSSRS